MNFAKFLATSFLTEHRFCKSRTVRVNEEFSEFYLIRPSFVFIRSMIYNKLFAGFPIVDLQRTLTGNSMDCFWLVQIRKGNVDQKTIVSN